MLRDLLNKTSNYPFIIYVMMSFAFIFRVYQSGANILLLAFPLIGLCSFIPRLKKIVNPSLFSALLFLVICLYRFSVEISALNLFIILFAVSIHYIKKPLVTIAAGASLVFFNIWFLPIVILALLAQLNFVKTFWVIFTLSVIGCLILMGYEFNSLGFIQNVINSLYKPMNLIFLIPIIFLDVDDGTQSLFYDFITWFLASIIWSLGAGDDMSLYFLCVSTVLFFQLMNNLTKSSFVLFFFWYLFGLYF